MRTEVLYRGGLLFYFIICWLVVVVGNSKYHLLSYMKSGNTVLEFFEFWLYGQNQPSPSSVSSLLSLHLLPDDFIYHRCCRNVERSRLKITSKANNLVVLVLLPAFTCNCFTDPLFWDVAQTCRTGLESCIAISFEKWEETLVLLTYFCVNLTHDTAINVVFLPSPQKLTLQYLLLTEATMKWLLTDHTDGGRVFQVTRFLS